MKKKILGLGLGAVVAGVTLASLTSCGASDVFHIYAWNTEFQGFFYKYVSKCILIFILSHFIK